MKDWSLVGIILGTIIIIGVGICEQAYLSHFSKEMKNEIIEVEKNINAIDIEAATIKLQNIITKWEKDEKILETLINHQDIHKISDCLMEIYSKLKDFSNSDNVSANFALLKEYIINIDEGNKFTTNNIL